MNRIVSKEPIRKYTGEILGFIETDSEGNQLVRNFYGNILGRYDKKSDTTRDFYGRLLTKGNTAIGLIYKNQK